MNISAGSPRHRITVNAPGTYPDAYGQPVQTWTLLYECWAGINAITSKEMYSLGGFTSQVTHKVTLRYPAISIKAGMQVLYEGRTFSIQAVSDPTELKAELDLFCQETSS
jgi:SPP1 family predicted phage head-tail adaptor